MRRHSSQSASLPSIPRWSGRVGWWAFAALLVSACASIPADRYGIRAVEFEGVEVMDPGALGACLATRPRPRITLQLGLSAKPVCGRPPFDAHPPRIGLWRWSWTDWPLYDEVVFERDLERIVRWYQARGYYDARVVGWQIDPPSAMASDTVESDTDCERDGDDEGCRAVVTLEIFEGEPVRVSSVSLGGLEGFPGELIAELHRGLALSEGDRFDEADYDRAKASVQAALAEAGYARAQVTGRVRIDRARRTAGVDFTVEPGPPCVFGEVRVEGAEDLPADPIREATLLEPGDPFSTSAVRDAQQAVYDLDAFASVDVRPVIPDGGDVIDVTVVVVPARRSRFQVGAGIQSGIVQQGPVEYRDEVPQWDVHLLGAWEHRNLFGGLRRFRVEERPRLIFASSFPAATDPSVGNVVSARFGQPAFLEPRTTLVASAKWELGPDPFLDIFRHQLEAGLDLERFFFERRVFATVGLREQLYLVPGDPTPAVAGATVPASSDLLYLEQLFRLDLRDDPLRTRSGLHLALSMHEAGYFLPSSWNYFLIVPDLRFYVPLPWGFVMATRFSLGAMFLSRAESSLDDLSRELGPTTERLRGGGGTSNRGFFPGELGDGPEGGVRRWLASAELRVPVTRSFFLTLFMDAGDVSRTPSFRFDHPQASVGLGLRLLTLLGPIRLDFGWRVPELQVLADVDERSPGGRRTDIDLLLFTFPGAVNLTIGDAF